MIMNKNTDKNVSFKDDAMELVEEARDIIARYEDEDFFDDDGFDTINDDAEQVYNELSRIHEASDARTILGEKDYAVISSTLSDLFDYMGD